jgi:hypothetical protein
MDVAPRFSTGDIASDPLGRMLAPNLVLLEAALREATLRVERAEAAVDAALGTLATTEASAALVRARRFWVAARAQLDAARRGTVP